MQKVRICFFAVSAMVAAAAAVAVAQMEPPKPAPELKRLDYFVGKWTLDGDMKPGAMGPGGKMTEMEDNAWMDGGFFLVGRVDFKSSMGNGTGTSYMGYDPRDKMYTYDAFNSWGEAEHAKGMVSGDTWTWTSESDMMGHTTKTRFTVKEVSADSYTFKFEMSGADGAWSTAMDGKATKNK